MLWETVPVSILLTLEKEMTMNKCKAHGRGREMMLHLIITIPWCH